MRASLRAAWAVGLAGFASTEVAWAQADRPLPPLPPPSGEASTTPPMGSGPVAPPGAIMEAPPPSPPAVVYAPPPPPQVVYIEPEPPTHAPRFSLWVGGRLGLLAYGGGVYINSPSAGTIETTGNFVRPGLGLELDVGARLAKRYIPYVGLELGALPPGHRFAQSSTSAHTTFVGVGLRFLAGDPNTAAFLSDVSFGFRKFEVSSGANTWSITGLELFRIGLGAEIRVNNRFTVSPILTISGGSLTDTSGNISFAANQGDGQTGPPFTGNASIPGWAQTTYYAIVLGCGAHVDLFGN